MNEKLPLSVTIITRNEEVRIAAAIESVKGIAAEVIIIDSQSTDRTVEIAKSLGARVETRPFMGFGQQKNLAHSLCTQEWVLNLDADERVSPTLAKEIREKIFNAGNVAGYFLPRKTWYLDRWVMHSGWYPNYLLRLCKKQGSSWTEPAIHEALTVSGATEYFTSPIEHYSFPDQRSHILKNVEYAGHAKDQLLSRNKSAGIFDLVFRPLWKFFDIYIIKQGFLDGRAGLFIAAHSSYALFLRYTYLYEQAVKNSHSR